MKELKPHKKSQQKGKNMPKWRKDQKQRINIRWRGRVERFLKIWKVLDFYRCHSLKKNSNWPGYINSPSTV